MKIEFLNPFIVSAAEVLHKEVGTQVTRGQAALKKGLILSNDVTVLISLVGQVQGTVMFHMAFDTAKGLVSAILGQPFEHAPRARHLAIEIGQQQLGVGHGWNL